MPRDESGRPRVVGEWDADSVDSLLREAVEIPDPSGIVGRLGLMPGDVLSDRFVVERRVGSGGMGAIYRGTDVLSGEAVAIKVMASEWLGDANRFAHEAVILAELSHPAIVRYVAHGTTAHGTRFLAMEWLDGEDLSARLARTPLTMEESVALVRRACEGISVAHARGVVHRDLKPSNLFLPGGDPASAKVLDFGIARHRVGSRTLTHSGTMLGTVGYMSPEQATGPRDVDARADVFALGCVLFECLTGRAAFAGPNAVAVLAKVLCEEPPRVSEYRPGVAEAVDALVARMLAKNPDERPNDAAAIVAALDELGQAAGGASYAPKRSAGLDATEQKIVSVILGRPRPGAVPAKTRAPLEADMSDVEELARRFGAEPVPLRGGGLLIVLSGRGAATDQAGQAAMCALEVARLRPDLCLVVATGRAETTGRIPIGAAIDRASELLAGASDASRARVLIDELTAGLLDPSFDVRHEGVGLALVGRRVDREATRLLMGKPTPFVGRDRELGLLELTLRECVDDGVARAVLFTGPPGQGKSRLRHEFVSRVRDRGDVRILIARADPIGAGSSFALLRQLVRDAIGLRDGDPGAEQYAKLRARVGDVHRGQNTGRIADFLGVLIDAPSPEHPGPELRAARNDPNIMAVWLRRSFGEWIAAECAACPLVLVLEDLHWGDLPSTAYIDEALRSATSALMVLALARPEVHNVFPGLWTGAEKIEVALGRLTPRAAERLVREVLGGKPAPDAVQRIVERADGNAFHLEELIRYAAEGDESLPETVLALVQSRLERLDPEARQAVRAASIFGEILWASGVAAVLGNTDAERDVRAWLETLVHLELLAVDSESRFPGEREYRFRHGLLREAAYGMLTDANRAIGHGLAGEWLERAGEKDALTLAEHFERSGDRKRAIPWLRRAAEAALGGASVDDVFSLRDRAIDCGAEGVDRGLFRTLQARALSLRGDWRGCIEGYQEAMGLLPAASSEWFGAAAGLLLAGSYLGDSGVTAPALQDVLSVRVQAEPSGPYGFIVCSACQGLIQVGQVQSARTLLERAEATQAGRIDTDPVFVMWLCMGHACVRLVEDDLGGALEFLSEARSLAERTSSIDGRAMAAGFLIQSLFETGNVERVEALARETFSHFEVTDVRILLDWTTIFLALTRAGAGRIAEAAAPLRAFLDKPNHRMATAARTCLSRLLLETGELEAAARESAAATAGALFPAGQAGAFAAQSIVELRLGRPESALVLAERGLEAAARTSYPNIGSSLRLARAEALYALGQRDAAHAAIREAADRILRIAATLQDPALRASYLTDVPSNARTRELCREWLRRKSP